MQLLAPRGRPVGESHRGEDLRCRARGELIDLLGGVQERFDGGRRLLGDRTLGAGELAALDAVCERVQMARSHFLRQAAKHFRAFVVGGGEQGQRWKESSR